MVATDSGSRSPLLGEIEWPRAAFVSGHRDPETEAYVKQALGGVPDLIQYVAPVRWMVDAFIAVTLWRPARLSRRLYDLIQLVVSQDNACRYCYGATRAAMKVMGFTERALRSIESDLGEAAADPREAAALTFARKISRSRPRIGAGDLAEMRASGFTNEEIAELTVCASLCVFSNRVATLLAIPRDSFERAAEGFFGPVLRPIFAWAISRHKPIWRVDDFPAAGVKGFDSVLGPLVGTGGDAVLGKMLLDAWASPALTTRAKSLVMAVTARAIGCPQCERGARLLLEGEGFPRGQIDDLLRHLNTRDLDPFEAKLVNFSRDTVYSHLGSMHARCREFYAGLSDIEIVEVAGMTALANCATRMTVLSPE